MEEKILYVVVIISFILFIILHIKNYFTKKKIKHYKNQIKPFEIKVKRDKETMRNIEHVELGDILSRSVYTEDKIMLFRKDMVVSKNIKKILEEKKIPFVWIKNKEFRFNGEKIKIPNEGNAKNEK